MCVLFCPVITAWTEFRLSSQLLFVYNMWIQQFHKRLTVRLINVVTSRYYFWMLKLRDCESLLHIFGIIIHWIGMVGRVLFLWMNGLDGAWLCCVVVSGCVVKYQCETEVFTEDGYPRRCSRQAVIAQPEWSSLWQVFLQKLTREGWQMTVCDVDFHCFSTVKSERLQWWIFILVATSGVWENVVCSFSLAQVKQTSLQGWKRIDVVYSSTCVVRTVYCICWPVMRFCFGIRDSTISKQLAIALRYYC